MNDLEEKVKNGIDVDDVAIEAAMQIVQKAHDRNIDANNKLDTKQKHRRKSLYADAVKAMKRYCAQVLEDEKEIRRRNHGR
jgi:hypothetical protein